MSALLAFCDIFIHFHVNLFKLTKQHKQFHSLMDISVFCILHLLQFIRKCNSQHVYYLSWDEDIKQHMG